MVMRVGHGQFLGYTMDILTKNPMGIGGTPAEILSSQEYPDLAAIDLGGMGSLDRQRPG